MNGPLTALAILGASVWAVRHVRSRRHRTPEAEPDESQIPATLVLVPAYLDADDGPTGEAGPPGDRCMTGDANVAAWDHGGNCKVFWFDGTTDDAILQLARAGWEERGKPAVSEMCFAVPDPLGGEYAATVDNPIMVEIVAAALHAYYGVSAVFPPKNNSHFWVLSAWKRAGALVRRELCGAP